MKQTKKDDEYDLFDLIEIFWAGKWTIVALVFVSLAFGLSYNFYKKQTLPMPHFAVLAPYSVNLFRPLHSQICREHFHFDVVNDKQKKNLDCVRERMSANLNQLAETQWSKNKLVEQEWNAAGLDPRALNPACPKSFFCLILITRSPLDLKIYNEQFQKYNKVLTESIVKEVKAELSYQFKKDSNFVLASEAYAENIIELRRLLNGIESGQMAINFQDISILKIIPPHRYSLIMSLSFVLGGFLGCALVLLRLKLSQRQKSLA